MNKYLYCLIICFLPVCFGMAQTEGSIPVKEGKEGLYIFLADQALHPRNSSYFFGGATISKATGANGRYTAIAAFKAVESLEAFRKTAGADAVKFIRQLKKLADDAAVWNYITTHHKIEDYGLLAMNVHFLEAMGACYIDREARSLPAGTTVKYRIDFLPNGTAQPTPVEGSIITGIKAVIEKPVLEKTAENDSSLIVTWKSTVAGSPDAIFGDIWRKKGNYGRYERIGQTLARKDDKQQMIFYTWHEITEPNTQYYFYVVPTTLAGLAGPVSDTAGLISRNFSNIGQSGFMKATDTLNGIYLSWTPPQQLNLFAGLIVERSKNNTEHFQPLDTLPASASFYTDTRVLPNILYHYRIRMISIRQNMLTFSAQASATHKDTHLFLEAPENFKATPNEKGIVLSWKRSPWPDVSGYYVYRLSGNDWELVSNLVKDTVFTDSSVHDARVQYKYTVAAINYNNVKSEYANPAFARLSKAALPAMPLGVLAAADGGRILLTWKDMRASDDLVNGYNVYRRKIGSAAQKSDRSFTADALQQNGFTKVNATPATEVTFTDATAGAGLWEYAVTSVNVMGNESNAYNTVMVSAAAIGYRPPADVAARKTSKGIEVTWSASLQPGVSQYQVYRRLPSEKNATLIGSVSAGQQSFVDNKATAGQLYFYSVKVNGGNTISEASTERGVRF